MLSLNAEPLWDEGISTFLSGEYEKRNRPLTTSDLQQLASEQAVRVGDLLETLHLMVLYGSWHYCDDQGVLLEINEQALDELYAKGRIGPEDLKAFSGVWMSAL